MRDRPIPLFIPEIVGFDKLAPYLKQIDKNQWYSNRGPLVCDFETRIAAHFNYPQGGVATCASGTLGLISTLLALELPRGSKCVMPAWTFIGTMAAINAAGLEPVLADVELDSWALDVNEVKKCVEVDKEISAVIVVCPFGKMIDIALWEDFSKRYNIAVIIDGAACFDSFKQVGKKTKLPFIISLHATKVFGIGEGGLVFSENTDLINKVKKITNFGIDEQRQVPVVGINGKMSEYHAAVGHALLDEWHDYRQCWKKLIKSYQRCLGAMSQFSDEYITTNCILKLDKGEIAKLKRQLKGHMEFRCIWQLLDRKCNNALHLSQTIVSIPFYFNINLSAVNTVLGYIHEDCK
ncbi:hypothetical protein AVI51_00830 [Piscirickettsia salmonis]|uniref:UDP-2-acetamido-2-deoxy-3-oxo-D-glucuronate aminotransferase n=1 Tax=Piscirickettsia salmonis TaxID=1238 RepID=A0A9Q6PWC5_PISSA|nr:DegT/DnrJ/EryC1/StrS family aminotransferase [Piscirickettsia salmonis]ALA24594.1 degT/DnrJ/EryC1/StrS aminotransferase family protein [Piscirickettsia salmonis]APS44943.1 hypothetical protein AVI48_11555 [Piscirickettsia salmonis]APS48304.1 hypothetical protein AVI49_12165 [Piscirickettsia salmonis]APS49564.1 hypothetical protein AVI50_00850 [Piscirickettsia salmonis]APS52747.1 hypothetical protein AVI51_00830 [Piscirickettsia salmonis]